MSIFLFFFLWVVERVGSRVLALPSIWFHVAHLLDQHVVNIRVWKLRFFFQTNWNSSFFSKMHCEGLAKGFHYISKATDSWIFRALRAAPPLFVALMLLDKNGFFWIFSAIRWYIPLYGTLNWPIRELFLQSTEPAKFIDDNSKKSYNFVPWSSKHEPQFSTSFDIMYMLWLFSSLFLKISTFLGRDSFQ